MPCPVFSPDTKLPDTGYLRLTQILGNHKASPPIPPILPIGKSQWYAGVRSGKYPKPIKLSSKTAVYRVEDIKALLEKIGAPAHG